MESSLSTTHAFSREDGRCRNTGQCGLWNEFFETTLHLPARSSRKWIQWCSSARGNVAIHDPVGTGQPGSAGFVRVAANRSLVNNNWPPLPLFFISVASKGLRVFSKWFRINTYGAPHKC